MNSFVVVVVFNGIFYVCRTMAEHDFAEQDIIVVNQVQADKKWPFVEKAVQVRESKYMVSAWIRLSAEGRLLAGAGG